MFAQVEPGDLLVFYVFKPARGIVAICKVVSEIFEAYDDIWGKDRYPFRVKLKFIPGFSVDENRSIPLSSLYGTIDLVRGIEVEPYLRQVSITRLSEEAFHMLEGFFRARQT